MKKTLFAILLVFHSISLLAQSIDVEVKEKGKQQAIDNERDNIYMLLAYSIVEQDWQESTTGGRETRGYNIGGVLVNKEGKLVNWARNSVVLCKDKTQHGEVRMLQAELQRKINPSNYAEGYSLYTTLEPCMMCSGMITFLKTKKVVYGQQDPDFGLNIERLKQPIAQYNLDNIIREKNPNSREKGITSTLSSLKITKRLDSIYDKKKDYHKNNITEFLASEEAHALYQEAKEKLLNYEIQFEENRAIYNEIINFYNKELPKNKETEKDCPCTSCK